MIRIEWRIQAIVCLLLLSGTALGTHFSGALWPAVPIGGLLIGLFLLGTQTHVTVGVTAALAFGSSFLIRLFNGLLTPSVPGDDPSKFATFHPEILQSGSLSPVTFDFYRVAGSYSAFLAEISLVTGLDVQPTWAVGGAAVGAIIALLTWTYATRFIPRNNWPSAAVLAAFLAATVVWAWRFIPQTVTVAYVAAFLILLPYTLRHSRASVTALVVLWVGMAASHKLALPVITVGLFVSVGVSLLSEDFSTDSILRLGFISGMIGFVQFGVFTGFFQPLIQSLLALAAFDFAAATPTAPVAGATLAADGVLGFLTRRAHGLVIIALGGLGWLFVMWRHIRQHEGHSVLLGMGAVFGAITVAGALSLSALNPARAYLLGVPVLFALATIAISRLDVEPSHRRSTLVVVVGILLVVQVGAVYYAPDAPDTRRQYLTEQEQTATSFSTFTSEAIVTDRYYAKRARQIQGEWSSDPGAVLNGTPPDARLFGMRDIDTYRFYYEYRGRWRLDYNPTERFEGLNRVYNNGAVTFYNA